MKIKFYWKDQPDVEVDSGKQLLVMDNTVYEYVCSYAEGCSESLVEQPNIAWIVTED